MADATVAMPSDGGPKADDDAPVECVDCKRSAKAEQRAREGGLGCDDLYKRVDACMAANRGQVSACTEEWTAFRACRQAKQLK